MKNTILAIALAAAAAPALATESWDYSVNKHGVHIAAAPGVELQDDGFLQVSVTFSALTECQPNMQLAEMTARDWDDEAFTVDGSENWGLSARVDKNPAMTGKARGRMWMEDDTSYLNLWTIMNDAAVAQVMSGSRMLFRVVFDGSTSETYRLSLQGSTAAISAASRACHAELTDEWGSEPASVEGEWTL